jgi:hypothetical protein
LEGLPMRRMSFLILLATISSPLFAADLPFTEADGVRWYDARDLEVEGQGWKDVRSPFDRLPAKAEGIVREAVWGLSRHSAGLAVRFETDAPEIRANWTLTSANLAMPHMPATGVSGLDLYALDDKGRWRWVANGRPSEVKNAAVLASGLPQGKRQYLFYFPLYNGVTEVKLGVPGDSQINKAPAYSAQKAKPVVFYGTSITQGGCASRPGMVHMAILGRWYHRPVINLGFSGNGRMEPEIAELMAEIDAQAYVIDCLPNMEAAQVAQNTKPLVEILRKTRPDTPIVLVEDRDYTNAWLLEGVKSRNRASQAALKKSFDELQAAGVKHLHYIAGPDLLGDDAEGTVDNSHPTDLGFLRQAEAFDKVLRPLCK